MNRIYKQRRFYCINISWFSYRTKSKQIYTDAFQSLLFFSTCSHFVDWSRKLKVRRANCWTISPYPVRFSTNIVNDNNIFFLPVFVGFFCFSMLFSFFCLLFLCMFFCLKQKIYILIYIQLCGRVSDEKIFARSICGNKTTFFCPSGKKLRKMRYREFLTISNLAWFLDIAS